MSSTGYSTELKPDPLLRRALFGVALAALAAGTLLLVALPVMLGIRLAGCALWVALGVRELLTLRASFRHCRCIRIGSEGSVEVARHGGQWQPATLLPGSVVLQRIAWLRFVGEDGRQHAELLIGNARENECWRRLQVIWRHLPYLGTNG